MSWRIGLIKNEPKISDTLAKALFRAKDHEGSPWDDLSEVTYKGNLHFNEDHMEWMDYFASQAQLLTVMCKHKAKGDIWFGSLDGDNAGEFWGYRFDGKGGMTHLKGRLVFDVVETSRRDKPTE